MDQDIPTVRQWVEEKVRHYLQVCGKQGEVEVVRHPKQDFQGVQVRVSVKDASKPAKLDVLEMEAKFDKPKAERLIEGFVRTLPA